jgi:hypothetical protein
LSDGTWLDSRRSADANWSVSVIKGATVGYESADPYLVDDRGVYFDGINDFLTIHDLIVHHTFAMTFWMKPESSGTLYSSSMVGDHAHE